MRKLARLFSYSLCFVFKFIPEKLVIFFSWALAILWVDILKIRKKVMKKNLNIVVPNLDEKEQTRIMRKSLFILVKSAFDLFKIPYITEDWIKNNVIFHGFELLNGHDGVLFMSLHMASGDLGSAVISQEKIPLSLISKRFSNQFVDEFWFSIRQRSKTIFIDAHGKNNAFDILKSLRQKRGVIFVLDQFMGKPYGVKSTFFGQTTGTAYGLALFALKTKKPVFPLYSYWGEDNKLNIVVKPAIDLSNSITDDSNQDRINMTNRFNQELESIILEHLDHWMWVHNRWKVFE